MKEMELFDKNKKLVHYVVRMMTQNHSIKQSYSGMEYEDLTQIGFIGLWKACQRFDESVGVKFSTYAVPTIQGEITNAIRVSTGTIKVPRQSKVISKVISKRKDNDQEYQPTAKEVAEEFECTEDTARIALEILDISFLSLDAPPKNAPDENITLMDTIKNSMYENYSDSVINNIMLKQKLSLLTEQERKVVLLSMNEVTQKEIGKIVGIGQVQVSRLLKKAINKMKDDLEVAV